MTVWCHPASCFLRICMSAVTQQSIIPLIYPFGPVGSSLKEDYISIPILYHMQQYLMQIFFFSHGHVINCLGRSTPPPHPPLPAVIGWSCWKWNTSLVDTTSLSRARPAPLQNSIWTLDRSIFIFGFCFLSLMGEKFLIHLLSFLSVKVDIFAVAMLSMSRLQMMALGSTAEDHVH